MSLDAGQVLKHQQDTDLAESQPVDAPQVEEMEKSPYRKLFTKIKPEWSPDQRTMMDELKSYADQIVYGMFGEMLDVLDEIGRTDKDFQEMTVTQLEKALWRLQSVRVVTSTQVTELYLEALAAKHFHDDILHESWDSILEGTQGDRKARAERKAKDEKYQAYFRYFVWSRANALQKELENAMRLIDRMISSRTGRF